MARCFKSSVTSLVLGVLCVLLTGIMWSKASVPRPDDFLHYWTAVRYIKLFGPSNIYGREGEQAVFEAKKDFSPIPDPQVEIVHTPLLYAAVDVLSSGAIDTDARRFHTISLVCYAFAVAVLLRWFRYSLNGGMMAYILLLHFTPKFMDSLTSNLTGIQLGLLAVALVAVRQRTGWGHFAAGVTLGLLVVLKPNTVFIPFFLFLSRVIRRQWRCVFSEGFGTMAGGAAGLFAGASLFGSVLCWRDWFERMKEYPIETFTIETGNFSLPYLVRGITGYEDVMQAVTIAGAVAVSIRIVRLSRSFLLENGGVGQKSANDDSFFDLQIVAAGCFAWLLYMNLVWTFYYTFTVPMIILLFSGMWRQKRNIIAVLTTCAAVSAIQFPMFLNAPSPVSAWFMWGGALILFAQGTSRPISAQLSLKE